MGGWGGCFSNTHYLSLGHLVNLQLNMHTFVLLAVSSIFFPLFFGGAQLVLN